MGMTIETQPIHPAAQRALERWLLAHKADVAEILEPFDLKPNDIGMPKFHRIVVIAIDDEGGDLFLGGGAATPGFASTRAPLPASGSGSARESVDAEVPTHEADSAGGDA